MLNFLEQLLSSLWNAIKDEHRKEVREAGSLPLGHAFTDDAITGRRVTVSTTERTMHMAVIGKTGSGKSSLLRQMMASDIAAGRGFFCFDLHGETTQAVLRMIAAEERTEQKHLSDRVVLISPGNRAHSIGFNPLEETEPSFVRVAELAAILRQRWGLDHFGARTDELLRNALFVLSANRLTLLELTPLLTHDAFRNAALTHTPNAEVRQYFEQRYGKASEAMRAVMREPILNKTSAFTADPNFRHIIGQAKSSFSMREAMDRGYWVIADLDKGQVGEQALTLASLLFPVIKNALFARERRSLFTIYADEMQNFVGSGLDIETVLSEARKFGVGVVSANQFLDQYPAAMRAAILSVGTHIFFQSSGVDAATASQLFDGGKALTERLKNLPQRHFVVKSGAKPWVEAVAPNVETPKGSIAGLLDRVRTQWTRPRIEIEAEIGKRQAQLVGRAGSEALDGWE